MKIIVPMAGRGSRFAAVADTNPAYQKPKPLIDVMGKPMVKWAVDSLRTLDVSPKNLAFICLREHENKYELTAELKKIFGEEVTVILIPEVTRGAVETVLVAKSFINPDEGMIISDSDHYFDATELGKVIKTKANDVAGIIPVFRPPDNDPKWSFTLFDKNQYALGVGEKDAALAAQGAHANIGAYYFSKGKYFLEVAEASIKANETFGPEGKREFFVAPLYQKMLDNGLRVKAAIIPEVWGLGTPSDLEHFLANYKK